MRKPFQGMATTRTGPGGECRYAILLHSLESIRGTEYAAAIEEVFWCGGYVFFAGVGRRWLFIFLCSMPAKSSYCAV